MDDDGNEDNVVILGENTKYPPMKWRFPHTDTCPKVYCNKYFESRHATQLHYYKVHAKNDLLCKECDLLISMTGQNNMINHYQRKHPNLPIPMPIASVSSSETEAHTPPKSTNPEISADKPSYIDRIIERNERITHHNADQSRLNPIPTAKRIDKRRNHMLKLNGIKKAKVSLKSVFVIFRHKAN